MPIKDFVMYDVPRVINEFRQQNHHAICFDWDNVVCDYCVSHCWEMAMRGQLYHAEPHYLNGWSEAVAMCGVPFDYNVRDSVYRMIFEQLGKSDGHRHILLGYGTMAFGLIEHHMRMYLTIRAR